MIIIRAALSPPFLLYKNINMAINVDTVYKTVLLILNKEQRGYLTPDEFNKIATQVQLEIFEKYFEDLNQQLRVPENDSEYANRVKNVDDKISSFKTTATCTGTNPFTLPSDLHRIGTVIYKDITELQRVRRDEFLNINMSPLTKPTVDFPVYILEDTITVHPSTIVSDVTVSYVKKPSDVLWSYITGSLGQLTYTSGSSTNFELHESEQTEVILNILIYAGLVIRDPQVIQTTANKVQLDKANEKS